MGNLSLSKRREGWREIKVCPGQEEWLPMIAAGEGTTHFCGLDTTGVLSVLRYDYIVVVFDAGVPWKCAQIGDAQLVCVVVCVQGWLLPTQDIAHC